MTDIKKRVLVFPCGSEIGLEIYKSINYSTHFNVVGGSSVADHGKYVYEDYIDNLPFVEDDLFIEKINKVIIDRDIQLIFPAHDSVVLELAKAEHEGRLACKVVGSPFETCRMARSKGDTYQTLSDVVAVPKLHKEKELSNDDFPVFLKPDVGQGSKGTYKASNLEEVSFYKKRDKSLLILEYLPGSEFTVDCFTDAEGSLLYSEGRLRARISNGISVNSKAVSDPRFHDLAMKINEKIIFNGAWFFQVKENKKNDLVLMEVAPRIAGTMGLARNKGVNLALLSLFNITGLKVDIFENNYDLTIDRALENRYSHNIEYEHVYVDLDDTLIVNSKVNVELVAFLFQCINKDVKLHLITRHDAVLNNTLIRHKLVNIFDDVELIDRTSKKSSYIKFEKSIFIDDAFSERKEVHDKLGIPVFDPHAIESLRESV